MTRGEQIQAAIDKLGLTKAQIVAKAIERIKTGASSYSCLAINAASGWPADCGWAENPIVQEYEEFMHHRPSWWQQRGAYTEERIAALQAFKEHLEKQ